MATTSVLNPTSSQLTVDVAADTGNTVSIASVTMLPQPGAARLATVKLVLTPAALATFSATIQFLFSDAAFEDSNIWGANKSAGGTEGQVSTVL